MSDDSNVLSIKVLNHYCTSHLLPHSFSKNLCPNINCLPRSQGSRHDSVVERLEQIYHMKHYTVGTTRMCEVPSRMCGQGWILGVFGWWYHSFHDAGVLCEHHAALYRLAPRDCLHQRRFRNSGGPRCSVAGNASAGWKLPSIADCRSDACEHTYVDESRFVP